MITVRNLNIASAKRSKNERSGIHKWHPYYAGFSESFVSDVLDFFGAEPGSLVLDPWMGSGTTAVVCQKKGIQCYGIEINPIMVDFAKAKCAKLLYLNINKYIEDFTKKANNKNDGSNYNSQNILFLRQKHLIQLSNLSSLIYNEFQKSDIIESKYIESFLKAALYITIRQVGYFRRGSNPTWLARLKYNTDKVDDIDAVNKFKFNAQTMLQDLDKAFSQTLNENTPLSEISIGNSKQLPFKTNKFDFVISSPPYLTRIDYAVSTKPELLFIGYEEQDGFDKLRRATMGAPVICDKDIEISDEWGVTCSKFLKEVKAHPTKASKSYYLPIFLQYFRDAYLSLLEIKRVLNYNGKACIVVQSSYFKDVEAKLGDIYVEMGVKMGLRSIVIKHEAVKQHFAHLNTKSSKYVQNKVYYEDSIVFENVDVSG